VRYSLVDRRQAIAFRFGDFTLSGLPVDAVVLGVEDADTLTPRLDAARDEDGLGRPAPTSRRRSRSGCPAAAPACQRRRDW
jgi:hypothetical protein